MSGARPGDERGESGGGRQAPCGLRLRRYDGLCPHRGSTADHKDNPRLRAPRAGSARARGRGQRDAARGAAAGAQGEGNRRRPLCRQHAGRSRRRRAGWCELDAVREGARLHQLRAALRLRGAPVQHPAGVPGRAARALPAADGARRARRVPGDDGAAGGLGPAQHENQRQGARRGFHHQRHQTLHQPRRSCRLRDPVRRQR